jgi:hypothetical protein
MAAEFWPIVSAVLAILLALSLAAAVAWRGERNLARTSLKFERERSDRLEKLLAQRERERSRDTTWIDPVRELFDQQGGP